MLKLTQSKLVVMCAIAAIGSLLMWGKLSYEVQEQQLRVAQLQLTMATQKDLDNLEGRVSANLSRQTTMMRNELQAQNEILIRLVNKIEREK
ncbi:hypothetical protein [Pseudomonas sp. p1(2021b)]|uniref:hypothetical protein n=1 Tax=Pseudomonas sp. p1(2021b) TaxID=2874628 RepID=UPI003D2802EC